MSTDRRNSTRLDEVDRLEAVAERVLPAIVRRELAAGAPHRFEVKFGDAPPVKMERQHYMFEAYLNLLACTDGSGKPLNIVLVGPGGNGKTTMAVKAASASLRQFVLQPFNPQTTEARVMGYMDANGRYVPSPFYDAFVNGKLYIADEFDTANAAVATIVNAAIANRVVTFPNNETREAHKAFSATFIMNTYGTGGDDRYVGRNRLDIATLDRFVFLHVPIDEGLESYLVGVTDEASPVFEMRKGGSYGSEREIRDRVRAIRRAVEKLGLRYLFSPRTTYHSVAMHQRRFGKDWIEECAIWRGMPDVDKRKILAEVGKAA